MSLVAETLAVGLVGESFLLIRAVTTGQLATAARRAGKRSAFEAASTPPAAASKVTNLNDHGRPDMLRSEAAKVLGVSERTVYRMGQPDRAELEEVREPGQPVRVTTASVRRALSGHLAGAS